MKPMIHRARRFSPPLATRRRRTKTKPGFLSGIVGLSVTSVVLICVARFVVFWIQIGFPFSVASFVLVGAPKLYPVSTTSLAKLIARNCALSSLFGRSKHSHFLFNLSCTIIRYVFFYAPHV